MEIEAGIEYPIVLGSTFSEEHANTSDLSIVRYDFIPASAAQAGEGRLTIDLEQHKATVTLPNAADGPPVEFTGKYEDNKDGLECVAIFDGSSFRIELVSGHATIRHAPGLQRGKLPPPPIKVKQQKLGGSKKGKQAARTSRNTRQSPQKKEQQQQQAEDVDIKDAAADDTSHAAPATDPPDPEALQGVGGAPGSKAGEGSAGVFTSSDAKAMSELERSFFLGDEDDDEEEEAQE